MAAVKFSCKSAENCHMSDQACVIAAAFLKKLEGFRAAAYKDGGGRWTIGYGHAENVQRGDVVGIQTAELLLTKDVVQVAETIEPELPAWLNDNQRAALISFTFNVGQGKEGVKDGFLELKTGGPSTLLKLIQSVPPADPERIGEEFLRWIYVEGEPSTGLCSRRNAERTLYLTPDSPNSPGVAPPQSLGGGASL